MMELGKETILGAMLIELPRMAGISITDFLTRYQNLFGRYVDNHSLKMLLEEKTPAENWNIINRAKMLALGGVGEKKNNSRQPLCSVFSNLSLDGSYPVKKYYEPAVSDVGNLIPHEEIRNFDCSNLVQDFFHELEACMSSPPQNFDAFLIVLDTLLKKYFWSVPATEKQDEDISLYDVINTTTAIAAALVQESQKVKPYVMAAGHFSGIQNYIFSVSKVGAGGVTKRLRARSFYVNAMVSALAHCIIHKFRLPMVNILMLTGGKFYILLPNKEEAVTELQKIEKEVTEFLYEKYKGNLSLELVWEEIGDTGLCHYSKTITSLSRKIEWKKKRLLEGVLISGNEWNPDEFVVYQNLAHKSMCTSCRSALVEEGKEMCANCETDTEIGGKLPKIKQFSFSREKGQYRLLGDYYLNLDVSAKGEGDYLIMRLNNPDLTGMYHKPVIIYPAVNNVPLQEKGEVKTFSEIAEAAEGSKKLGILKADVDTLGFLFAEGLRTDDGSEVPVSRVNTLSRMLDLFFGRCIQHLIQSKYPNVYCVFSGGDDLFFIGPWNEMPELAIEINHMFHEYTGDNPCISLSAAICMAEGGGHISTLAEHCEQRLKKVKQSADEIISPGRAGRDGVYFQGKVMAWKDFEELIERGKVFAREIESAGVSVFRRLMRYSSMYQNYLRTQNVDDLMFLPLLNSDRVRNEETYRKISSIREGTYKKVANYRKVEKEFYYVEFCARYALQLTKKERTDGF